MPRAVFPGLINAIQTICKADAHVEDWRHGIGPMDWRTVYHACSRTHSAGIAASATPRATSQNCKVTTLQQGVIASSADQ